MGLRYLFFRIGFEIKKRIGLLKREFPVDPPMVMGISYREWEKQKSPFFFTNATDVEITSSGKEHLSNLASAIREGKLIFFSGIEYDLGKSYDWITNPVSGFRYDCTSHWTDINDYSSTSGDIKFVWEKSRFSYIYALLRDEYHNKNKHGVFVFDEIVDWINKNPINCGPNYKCSQEISIRVLNWIFALYYYSDQNLLDESTWQKIVNSIYWQMHHVYHNINFSRITVRNNHAITETLTLYIVGTLFPWMKDSGTWKLKGKKWFEKEVAYQVYEDGTYLQFSMNYHRVVIQLLTWAIGIAGKNNEKFHPVVYERAYRSVNFLFQCQDETSGYLPNYGANDGAIFFPLNSCEYRDFRPQLNALHQILTGTELYAEGTDWKEDHGWLGSGGIEQEKVYAPLVKKYGCQQFTNGGYSLIREPNSFTFIRCGSNKDRPSQADNLHIDIWANGENILVDGGSYKYNTDTETLRYFMGTKSHNTVMLDNKDQMLKGARFIWYYWTQCISSVLEETEDIYWFEGTISVFRHLNRDIQHTRTVSKKKNDDTWVIEDTISGKPPKTIMKQYWHLKNNITLESINFKATDGELVSIVPQLGNSFYSEKYGMKETGLQIVFSSVSNKINTIFSLRKNT